MSAEAPVVARSWRVGLRLCTLTIPRPDSGAAVCATVEWSPTVPTKLSGSEFREYRRGRDDAIRALAGELGGAIAVIDL